MQMPDEREREDDVAIDLVVAGEVPHVQPNS